MRRITLKAIVISLVSFIAFTHSELTLGNSPVPFDATQKYGINNNQVWFNDPAATNYVIFFIGRDGANLGGIFMNKSNTGFTLNLDHGHIMANAGWNQYKFVYMTAKGQKETNWISLNDGPPDTTDTSPPSVPGGLSSGNITKDSLSLTWNASTDDTAVTGYTVYMDGNEIQTVDGTTISISGLNADTSYAFSVKAFDAAGNISAASAKITVKTTSNGQTGYGISNNQVWFNDSVAIDYVIFFIGHDGVNLGGIFMNKSSTGFTLNLDHGHIMANAGWNQYKFVYMTPNGQKETSWIPYTNEPPVTTDTSPPSVPTGLSSGNITEDSLKLTWNASTDDTAVTGYTVYRDGNEIQTMNGTTSSISGLNADTSYAFSVKAFDAAGNVSAASAPITVKTAAKSNENLFPIRIVNTSGRPDNQVYVTFIGRFPEQDKMHIMTHLDFESSELIPIKLSDNDPQNDDKCTSYYRKLSDLTYLSENTYSFNIPRVASARLYISIDEPVYFHVNEEPAGLAEPNVLAESEAKSAYGTIYDIIEITWLYNQDLFVNTSNVDFLSIPFKIQMNLKDGSNIIRGYDMSRNDIFALAEDMGEPWINNIILDDNGEPIRLLGATYGTVAGMIPEDYLQPAIDKAWEAFKTKPINTSFEGWTLENGYVNSNEVLTITASHPAYGIETFTIAKPSSREGFASEGALANGSIIERKIQAFIGAAINRGVLQNTDSWWDWNAYYFDNNSNKGLYNKYSELLHSASIEGRCYGFSYDDVNGLDSSIWQPNEKELFITIPDL